MRVQTTSALGCHLNIANGAAMLKDLLKKNSDLRDFVQSKYFSYEYLNECRWVKPSADEGSNWMVGPGAKTRPDQDGDGLDRVHSSIDLGEILDITVEHATLHM